MNAKDTGFSVKKTLNLRGNLLDLDDPKVMGIINITPDSFYSDSRAQRQKAVLQQAETMLIEGADFLDIGGYSSRPGAEDITPGEEWSRLSTAIKSIKNNFPKAVLSVDTFRAEIARKAVGEGADIINDISGGELDKEMFSTVGELKVPYILMHIQGTPQTMATKNQYDHLIHDLLDYFTLKLNKLKELGVKDIVIDPGFGFAKNIGQNYEILRNLNYFRVLGVPILAGLSRKSLIYKPLNTDPAHALNGTTVLNTISVLQGASILRVHDVKEAVEIVKLIKLTYSKN